MKRFIANYTILVSGQQLINHITTVASDGTLIAIAPFDHELASTIYVPQPLCVAPSSALKAVEAAFHKATSRLHFMQLLQATHTPNPPSRTTTAAPQPGDAVAVLRLDFARNILTQL